MIYLDTSVALAHLLAEDRRPPAWLWGESLVSSRLLEYEMWVQLHSRGLAISHSTGARELLDRVSLVELAPVALERALDPFPSPIRTLDALHLASAVFLRSQGEEIVIASYDGRLVTAARELNFPIAEL